jgi:hypothetical protein
LQDHDPDLTAGERIWPSPDPGYSQEREYPNGTVDGARDLYDFNFVSASPAGSTTRDVITDFAYQPDCFS